jgi:hypothetical protein
MDMGSRYRNVCGVDRSNREPSDLSRASTADRLLGLRVRIPPRAWMFVLWVVDE